MLYVHSVTIFYDNTSKPLVAIAHAESPAESTQYMIKGCDCVPLTIVT